MLSVIVDAHSDQQALPALLLALTPAAMDGVVRDVVIAAPAASPMIEAVCEETGAEAVFGDLGAAAKAARHERVLVLPAGLRLKDGWIAILKDHLARGGQDAVLAGEEGGGLFSALRPAPFGVLTERSRLAGLAHSELKALRKGLRRPLARLG